MSPAFPELEAQLAAKKSGLQNGNETKTCYLTFDDGPSNNTEKYSTF